MADRTTPKYRVGTLTYTTFGLVNVFIWMLWGDFCFTLMDTLFPTLMPLMLRANGASNATIGLIVGSVPAVMNFVINPIVSTASDRTRSRWGRRIPYLFASTPFVTLTLVLMGWGPQIGTWLAERPMFAGMERETVVIGTIAVLVAGFQTFNMFVGSVFYYIFADVVPEEWMGRFMALFRFVGTVAAFVYNKFVLPHAETHMGMIFTVIAAVYFLSFLLMCVNVKEGTYPPVPPRPKTEPALRIVGTYFRECFSRGFYRWIFLGIALNGASTICRAMFNILFARETLSLSMAQYGQIAAVNAVIALCLYIPVGMLVDKLGPFRMYIWGGFMVVAANVFGFFFANGYGSFFVVAVLISLTYIVQGASGMPMMVAVFPKSRYGQFSSANAMVGSVMRIAANWGAGLFIDHMGYRYIFVWDFALTLLACLAMMAAYRMNERGNEILP